jgi:hypothetical protein
MSWDSEVSVATGRWLRGWNSSPGRVKNSQFSISFRPAVGPTLPYIQWIVGTLSPEVKWPRCETDQSPPTSTNV